MEKEMLVELCENDNRGASLKSVAQIVFKYEGDIVAELCPRVQEREFCNVYDQRIEMYGCIIKWTVSQEWHGNIFWNSYIVPFGYALGFLNVLMFSGKWDCSTALTEIFEKFDIKEKITAADFGIENVEGLPGFEPVVINKGQMELPFFDYSDESV